MLPTLLTSHRVPNVFMMASFTAAKLASQQLSVFNVIVGVMIHSGWAFIDR